MKNFTLSQFTYQILCDEQPKNGQDAADSQLKEWAADAEVTFEEKEGLLSVYLTAKEDKPVRINKLKEL